MAAGVDAILIRSVIFADPYSVSEVPGDSIHQRQQLGMRKSKQRGESRADASGISSPTQSWLTGGCLASSEADDLAVKDGSKLETQLKCHYALWLMPKIARRYQLNTSVCPLINR